MEPGTSCAPEAGRELGLAARLRRIRKGPAAAFDRLPIRTRLAAASAGLTLIILCVFAVVVGAITIHRLRSQFVSQVEATASQLPGELHVEFNPATHQIRLNPPLAKLAGYIGNHPVIKVFYESEKLIEQTPEAAPNLGPVHVLGEHEHKVSGYGVASRRGVVVATTEGRELGAVDVQYGQSLGSLESTIGRLELVLLLGVLGGVALSLLVGIMIARRAMAPIAALTATAAEIARTRDPSRSMPTPAADDEVSELARTLAGMLRELDSARAETEGALARQREFVADASHELRTPLTSILANLELLADALHGEQGEAARSALRSSQRMRRLVADLLLLARSDAGRVLQREPLDLGQVAVEASAELGPISAEHEIVLETAPVAVEGVRDELYRLALNLIENAVRHTPAGSAIDVRTDTAAGQARLIVQDNGPGIPAELRKTLFERFIRGRGDRGGSFGLGLAIVRAVADSHGGSVTVSDANPSDPEHPGARFVVLLPLAAVQPPDGVRAAETAGA